MPKSKYDSTWEFVECPNTFVSGQMELRKKNGSSISWYAFMPENHKQKVGSVTIEFPDGDVKTLVRLGMTFWFESGGTGGEWTIRFPAVVRVKDVNGKKKSTAASFC